MKTHSTYVFPKKTVKDVPLHGKRVLLRADFNVPLTADGTISSDYRIVQTVPTIEYLLKNKCEVVIISHMGRPKGSADKQWSLEPVAQNLSEKLGHEIDFIDTCIGDAVSQQLKRLQPGKITLLQNLRFHPGEESNDSAFAQSLISAVKPSYVVHDEFGAIHRAHASTEGISHLVPSVAGLLLEKEVTILTKAVEDPVRPLTAILGGAKISDKLPLVQKFLQTADTVLVGGAMANNFIAHDGYEVGESLIDTDGMQDVDSIVNAAKKNQLVTPVDVAVAGEISQAAERRDVGINDVKRNDVILDVGFETMRQFSGIIKDSATIVWNGTLGMTELPAFAQASAVVAEAIARQGEMVTSIIGGGDTADFVLGWLKDHPEYSFSHISTGGGASLELMSGMKLPGVEALLDA